MLILDEDQEFGRLLKKAKEETGKFRQSLVKDLGVTNVTWSKWEEGETFPKKDKLPQISELLGLDLDLLKEKLEVSIKAKDKMKEARKKCRPKKIWRD